MTIDHYKIKQAQSWITSNLSIAIIIYCHFSLRKFPMHFTLFVQIPIFLILINNFPSGVLSYARPKSTQIRSTIFPFAWRISYLSKEIVQYTWQKQLCGCILSHLSSLVLSFFPFPFLFIYLFIYLVTAFSFKTS